MKGVPLNEELYQYIIDNFVEEDDILKDVVRTTEEKEIPLIQVSPELGKFLQMLIKMINARNVLEIGTLTGYSTIWMARGLNADGKITTLEINEHHAAAAKINFTKAGLENKINLITGNALESLKELNEEKFDFVFIDADKPGYPSYYEKVIPMMNKGGIISLDNTLKEGRVISNEPDEYVRGIQILNEKISNDPRVLSLLIPISDGLTIGLVL